MARNPRPVSADLALLREQGEELARAVEGLSEGPFVEDNISDRFTHTE